MPISETTLSKLRHAFKGTKMRSDDETLPVGYLHSDKVPIRGSVHIGSGRVISREETDKRLKKAFK